MVETSLELGNQDLNLGNLGETGEKSSRPEHDALLADVHAAAPRFWRSVKKSDGCWEWSRSSRDGYGTLSVKVGESRKLIGAHVFSWLLHVGRLAEGFEVCHQCDNRRCVRPDHLKAGTRSDNVRDAVSRGRMPHSRHAISPSVAAAILAASKAGKTRNQISRELGVPRTTIFNIIRRGA